MIGYLSLLLGQLLTWVAVAAVALYASIVLMRYRSDGPRPRLEFSFENPARSAQQLAIWLGVKALAACVGIVKPLLNALLEALRRLGSG